MIHIAWCKTAPRSRTSCRTNTSSMVYVTPIYSATQDVAFSRCRCHMHSHGTASPLEPQGLLQEDTNCISEMSYKIYNICSFPLCIIKFFISYFGTYRPKYRYEFVRELSYIDDIKVVLWRNAINASVGKSAFRIELTLEGSCEDKHCVRKLTRAWSKAGQVMSRWRRLQGRWQGEGI